MQVWLDRGTAKVDGKSYRPMDALSSPELAPKLLSEEAPAYDADSSTNALVRLLREGRGRPA